MANMWLAPVLHGQVQALSSLLAWMCVCSRAQEPVLCREGMAQLQACAAPCFMWHCSAAEVLHGSAPRGIAEHGALHLSGVEFADMLLAHVPLSGTQQLCGVACFWAAYMKQAAGQFGSWCTGGVCWHAPEAAVAVLMGTACI